MDDDRWLCSACGDEPFVTRRVEETEIWLCMGCWELADSEWLDLILMVKEAENESKLHPD